MVGICRQAIFDIYLCLCHHYQYQKSPIIKRDLDRSSPECKDAHLVGEMEFSRSIEVEDGVEGTRMPAIIIIILLSLQTNIPVKEEFIVNEGVVRTNGHDVFMCYSLSHPTTLITN